MCSDLILNDAGLGSGAWHQLSGNEMHDHANRLSLAFLRQRFVLMRHNGFAAGDGIRRGDRHGTAERAAAGCGSGSASF